MTRPRLLSRFGLNTRLLAVLLGFVVGACSPGATGAPDASPGTATASPSADAVPVVATSTVLADLVRSVGGARVAVSSLVPKGGEVHTYDPSPSDLARLRDARLVVMNGLGLDDWLVEQVAASGSQAQVVELGRDLDGVTYLGADEVEDDAGVNPHLWLDVAHARRYVMRIAEALAATDPAGAAMHEAGRAAYDGRLAELDDWIRAEVAEVPEANRRIVSFHEAYPYYAAAYGLEIVGVIVEAPGQDPSAGEIAELVEAIRASGVRAVFTEAQFSPELAEAVAGEAGVKVVTDLYNDSLGDPPVDTYEAMMRWNTTRTVEALR